MEFKAKAADVEVDPLETPLQDETPEKMGDLESQDIRQFPIKNPASQTSTMIKANESDMHPPVEPTPSPLSMLLQKLTPREEIEDEKQTARSLMTASIGAIIAIVSIKKPRCHNVHRENIQAQQASIAMLFFSMLFSMAAVRLESLLHQPMPMVFRFLNFVGIILLAVGVGVFAFAS